MPIGFAQLDLARRAAVQRDKLFAGAVDIPLPAAQRAWRPVVAAKLVEHRTVNPDPRELLQRPALLRVVTVDRADQCLKAAGDEVLNLAARRDLAHLAVDDVLHHRSECENQAVAQARVAAVLVGLPKLKCLFSG